MFYIERIKLYQYNNVILGSSKAIMEDYKYLMTFLYAWIQCK